MKFLKVIKRNWIIILIILFSGFWLGFFGAEYIYNNQNTTYEVRVEGEFNEIDEKFFLDALAKYDEDNNLIGYSYASVDIKKIFSEEDIVITYLDGEVKIEILAKYFISSQAILVSEESQIRFDKVIKKVFTYYDKNSIISESVCYNNTSGIKWGLVGLGISLLVSMVGFFIFSVKNDKEVIPFAYDNVETFATPFKVGYWRLAIKSIRKMKVFDLCFISLLFALQMLCKLIVIPTGFANLGIGITYLVFGFICMVYGPMWGLVIGFFSDILGFFIFPNGSFFYFGYTIQAMLTGFVYGLFLYRGKLSFSRCLFARIIVNIVINAIFGSYLWGEVSNLTFEGVRDYFMYISLPKNIIFLIPQAILMFMFLKMIKPILKGRKIVPESLLGN